MRKIVFLTTFLIAFIARSDAHAATAYRCTDPGHAVAFQDHPCGRGQTQHIMHLDDVIAVPAAAAPVAAPIPSQLVKPPEAPAPTARLPAAPDVYLCIREDGSRYESADGVGEQHAVPLWVLGIPSQRLGGGRAGAGASGARAISSGSSPASAGSGLRSPSTGAYVWTADACHRATPEEACAYFSTELDKAEYKLRHASMSAEPPIRQEQLRLHERLSGC